MLSLPMCTSLKDNATTSLDNFEKTMTDSDNGQTCATECLPNCEQTTYGYSVDTGILDVRNLCKAGSDTRKV